MAQSGGNSVLGGVPRANQFGWYKRRLPVMTPLPMPSGAGSVPVLPLPVQVVRPVDTSRNGAFFKPLQFPGKINVPGQVLRPWTVRRDYERGGSFHRSPFLLIAAPHIPGGVPTVWVKRWDFERAGKFYRDRLPWFRLTIVPPPPPALVDGSIWYAANRGKAWGALLRSLTWSADVATFLTKRTGETRLYAMDFSALPELQNASLAGVSSVVAAPLTVGASNVTLTNPALGSNGKTAVVWISGGVSGASYKIAFSVTLAGGTVLEDFGYLLVEDE